MHLIYFLEVISTNDKGLQPKFPIQVLMFRPNTVIEE